MYMGGAGYVAGGGRFGAPPYSIRPAGASISPVAPYAAPWYFGNRGDVTPLRGVPESRFFIPGLRCAHTGLIYN